MTCTESDLAVPARRPFRLLDRQIAAWRSTLLRRRRRRATMDLIQSSPHLLRDIGLYTDTALPRAQQDPCSWR